MNYTMSVEQIKEAIRDRLAQDKSNLQPIEPSAVEYISSENASRIAAAGH